MENKSKGRIKIFFTILEMTVVFSTAQVSAVVTFDEVNKKIFTPICASCHSGGFPDADLDLTQYTSIKSKEVVVPFDPQKSLLLQKVVSGEMPAGGDALSETQIQLIRDWISDGALDAPPAATLNLKSINPLFGSIQGGYFMDILGENFTPDTEVTLDNKPCTEKKVISTNQINCRVPKAEGPGKVDVKVTLGSLSSTLEKSFEYRLPLGPTFSALYTHVFKPKCIGCHSGNNPPHDLDMSSYETLMSHRRAIVPGDLKKSRLYKMVSRGKMPLKPGSSKKDDDDSEEDDEQQADPLPQQEIEAIAHWILQGALNN